MLPKNRLFDVMSIENRFKLVSVEWWDAQSDCEWGDGKEVSAWGKERLIIYEVGWLVDDNDANVVITNQIALDGGIGNRTKIPKGMIKIIRRLEVGNDRKRLVRKAKSNKKPRDGNKRKKTGSVYS